MMEKAIFELKANGGIPSQPNPIVPTLQSSRRLAVPSASARRLILRLPSMTSCLFTSAAEQERLI